MGKDRRVTDFLAKLIASNPNAAKSLQTSMATITSTHSYRNQRKFKDLGDGVFEIKVPGIRLYGFQDEIDTLETKLIIATNGGTKNNKREQNSDINQATQIRARYFAAKNRSDTTLHYLTIAHEN